jgi:hypothetical protein
VVWQRLSVRSGTTSDDGPYDEVPSHLVLPLCRWVSVTFGGEEYSVLDYHNAPRLASAIRLTVDQGRTTFSVYGIAAHLRFEPQLVLDAVDAVLYLHNVNQSQGNALDEVLQLGGSVWKVGPSRGSLVRRVDVAAETSFQEASSPSDAASSELQEAWKSAYGRNPDASDAWDHSIKAVESVLIPVVNPNKAKATLADVVGSLSSQGPLWKLVLRGHDGSQDVGPLVTMLRLMWPNPDRHGSNPHRKPSLDEAQAVVSLAVTIVQWARDGVLSRR